MRVLMIIESHTDFRTLFKSIIERQHWEVEVYEAGTKEEGLNLIKEVKPDIVFFDIALRGDGEKLEIKIKAIVASCRVVVLTPFDDEAFSRWHKTDVIDDFISKDRLSENLIPIIGKFLEV